VLKNYSRLQNFFKNFAYSLIFGKSIVQKTFIVIAIILLVSIIVGAVILIAMGGTGKGAERSKKIKAGETVLISKDAGENWERAAILKTFDVREIFLSQKNPGRVFILTKENGIWFKERDSEEWKEMPSLKIKKRSPLYFMAEDRDNLYVSFYSDRRGRIVRYNLESGGEEEIYHTPLEGYGVYGIWPSDDGRVLRLISSDGGFYESVNHGYTWQVVYRFNEGLLGMTLAQAKYILWVITSRGRILKTVNGGRSWDDISLGLKQFDKADKIENLVFDAPSQFLYLASGYGILKSFSGTAQWEALPLLLPPESLPIRDVRLDQTNSNIIYAGSKNQFYKSEDSAKSWRIITLPTKRQISRIAVDLIDNKVIYIGLE